MFLLEIISKPIPIRFRCTLRQQPFHAAMILLCISIDKRWYVCPFEMFDSHIIWWGRWSCLQLGSPLRIPHSWRSLVYLARGKVCFFCGLQRSGCTRNVCRSVLESNLLRNQRPKMTLVTAYVAIAAVTKRWGSVNVLFTASSNLVN